MKAVLEMSKIKIFNPKRKRPKWIELDWSNIIDTGGGRLWVGIFSKQNDLFPTFLTKFIYLVTHIRIAREAIINREDL